MNSIDFCETCKSHNTAVEIYEVWLVTPVVNGRERKAQAKALCTSHAAELDEATHTFKTI